MPTLPRPAPAPVSSTVFTTLAVFGGRPILWPRHRQRLLRSCAELYGMHLPDDLDARVLACAAATKHLERARLRVAAALRSPPCVEVSVKADPVQPARQVVDLITVSGRSGVWTHKWADRRVLQMAENVVSSRGLPLFVEPSGAFIETSSANVLVASGDVLVVPRLSTQERLPGITLEVLIEEAVADGWRVESEPVTSHTLGARAAFLTSSVQGVVEVSSLDGRPLHRDADLARDLRYLLRRGQGVEAS